VKANLALAMLFVTMSAVRTPCVTRHYYIAAEEVEWDYAPSKMDLLSGQGIPQPWCQNPLEENPVYGIHRRKLLRA
jgi:hypothetical protein